MGVRKENEEKKRIENERLKGQNSTGQ